MTLAMPDSIDVASLPAGYGQYLGYVDGQWPTAPLIRKTFPAARLVALTVTGDTLDADGADIETGDLTVADGAQWARQKLNRSPGFRPVLYCSVSGWSDLIGALAERGVARAKVRLLSAHYGDGKHICGPQSCAWPGVPTVDGTQWTDRFMTVNGGIDMSALQDGFFGSWTEELVQQLPTVQSGDQGEAVRTVQGLCNARGAMLTLDGVFGNQTLSAVKFTQSMHAGVTVDGVVGPQTWPVLLGIA